MVQALRTLRGYAVYSPESLESRHPTDEQMHVYLARAVLANQKDVFVSKFLPRWSWPEVHSTRLLLRGDANEQHLKGI